MGWVELTTQGFVHQRGDTRSMLSQVAHPQLVAPIADADCVGIVQEQVIGPGGILGYVLAAHIAVQTFVGQPAPLGGYDYRWVQLLE